jgi:hypothetical protein
MARLTVSEQRKLIQALPASRIAKVKQHCMLCEQKGQGLMDIVKSVGKVLGPIAREVGPTILKELVIPFVKQKAGIKGKGATLPGGGVKLAGKGVTVPHSGKRLRNTNKMAGSGVNIPGGAKKRKAKKVTVTKYY